MKGFIAKTATGLCLALALSTLGGCYHYRNLVDPCWPERWNNMAAHSVRDVTNAQAGKGHLLEQTVWNWHFETDPKTGEGSDVLNGAGIERLRTITRTMPAPDFQLWLQNAQDIPYKGGAPDKLVAQRESLNTRRVQAIQKFLATQTNTSSGAFHVNVHDFASPGIPAAVITGTQPQPLGVPGAYQKLEYNFQGILPIAGSSSSSTTTSSSSSTAGASGASGSSGASGAPGGR